MKISQPTRMCIACRSRHPQNTLIRLRQDGKDIVAFDGTGRSFYLCVECVNNEKKVKGLVKRFKQDEEQFITFLRGLTTVVGSCDQSHLN